MGEEARSAAGWEEIEEGRGAARGIGSGFAAATILARVRGMEVVFEIHSRPMSVL